MNFADKIVVMDNSEIAKVGAPKDVLPEVKSIKVCARLKGGNNE